MAVAVVPVLPELRARCSCLGLLSTAWVEAGTCGLLEAPVRGGSTALPRGHGPGGRTRLHLPSRCGLALPALLSLRCRRRSGPPVPRCVASPQVTPVSVCRCHLSGPSLSAFLCPRSLGVFLFQGKQTLSVAEVVGVKPTVLFCVFSWSFFFIVFIVLFRLTGSFLQFHLPLSQSGSCTLCVLQRWP